MDRFDVKNMFKKYLILFQLYINQEDQWGQIRLSAINKCLSQMRKDEQFYGHQNNAIKIHFETIFQILSQIPIDYIDLLVNDGIYAQTSTLIVNSSQTITKIYQSLVKRINSKIISQLKKEQFSNIDFQAQFINQTNRALLATILNQYGKKVVDCFNQSKQIMIRNIESIDKKVKNDCQMMNAYLVFAMLKQMTHFSNKQIENVINKYFLTLPFHKSQQFLKYIQRNYEFIDLQQIGDGQNQIYTTEQYEFFVSSQNKRWLQYLQNYEQNSFNLKKISNPEGDIGFLLMRTSTTQEVIPHVQPNQQENDFLKELRLKDKENKQTENLIIKVENGNQIRIVNARVCQESWRIYQNTDDSIQDLYNMLKIQIESSDKNYGKQYVSYGVPTCQYATIGGSLGKCLADIDQYHDANQFFIDLSKTAAIYSTFSLAIARIPILSYFIIAGGFTYSFYLAWSNKATSSFKKINQVGNVTMTVVASVGSTLAGIFLGQLIIPVPFLGAFVGGVAGGYFGTKGVYRMNEFLDESNFRDTILYIKKKLVGGKYWKCTRYMLERIGINQKYFNKNTPSQEDQRDIYMTGICLLIVTIYQSKRYIQYTQRKLQQFKEKQEIEKSQKEIDKKIDSDNQKLSSLLIDETGKSQKQEQLQIIQQIEEEQNTEEHMKVQRAVAYNNSSQTPKQMEKKERDIKQEQQHFRNQFNIVPIIDFLTYSNFTIYEHFDLLQEFIVHLVK